MARSKTKPTTRRASNARNATRRRSRKRQPFVLRWYHLAAATIAAFCLGYLFAFGHATRYVSTVAGLR